MKQILFNLILFFIILMILTSWFLSLEQKLFAELVSVFIFWIGNLYFLRQAEKKQFPENLKSLEEYRTALKYHLRKSNTLKYEIRSAIHQLEAFQKKQRTLLAFDNSFQDISHDTEACLLSNMRKFLHRILILDLHENLQPHRTYLNLLLNQNQELLQQYNYFLAEVFQLDAYQMPCLDIMTEAFRDVRRSLQ
ncbi:MAG: hypothetical protein IKP69_06620 [Oscillospiraceae bacterium]|nr:hypothetical protein [Oscillospiraceae bacterium]